MAKARDFFKEMPYPVHVQWTNSPAVIELLKDQEKNGIDLLGVPGKDGQYGKELVWQQKAQK